MGKSSEENGRILTVTAASRMVQGCTSDAGKTTLVAALCRILKRRGVNVAPLLILPQSLARRARDIDESGFMINEKITPIPN